MGPKRWEIVLLLTQVAPSPRIDPNSEDAVLAASVGAGDRLALEEIFDRYGGAVKAMALRVLRDDALLKMWSRTSLLRFGRRHRSSMPIAAHCAPSWSRSLIGAPSTSCALRKRVSGARKKCRVTPLPTSTTRFGRDLLARPYVVHWPNWQIPREKPSLSRILVGLSYVEARQTSGGSGGHGQEPNSKWYAETVRRPCGGGAMTSHPMLDLVELYALDSLEDGERYRFEAHLHGCPLCQSQLDIALSVSASLVPDGDPPQHVWDRIVAELEQEERTGHRGTSSAQETWKRAVDSARLDCCCFGPGSGRSVDEQRVHTHR